MPGRQGAGMGLRELLAAQDVDHAACDVGYRGYKDTLVTDAAWAGWWGLWHFRDKVFYAVRLEQEGQTVRGDWLNRDGVREGFEGELSDSGLLLEGVRVGRMDDGRFVRPLSLSLSRDGKSIVCNWDWHLLHPRGTEPRVLTAAVPEVFLLDATAEEYDAVVNALKGPFAAVRRHEELKRYRIDGVEHDATLVPHTKVVTYRATHRQVQGDGRDTTEFATVREVTEYLTRHGYHSVWWWTPGVDEAVVQGLDDLPVLYAPFRTPAAEARPQVASDPAPSEDTVATADAAAAAPPPVAVPADNVLHADAVIDRIHRLKYVGAPLLKLTDVAGQGEP